MTIAGESAGALNVLSLLVSPLSRGLFQRAVVQSAPARTRDPAEGEERARRVLWQLLVEDRKAATVEEAADLAAAMSPREIRSYLRAKSDRELLRCYDTTTMGMIDNPAVFRDGHVLPAEGLEALSSAMGACLGSFVREGDPNPPGSPLPRWEPWSNDPGGPKCLVLDADKRTARIGMMREELTEEGVFASIERELPAELAARTREYLLRSSFAWGPR